MSAKKFLIEKEKIKKLLSWDEPEGCFASDRILVDGKKVGYMYREEPDNESDSGWRFFAGDESQEYADNPNNFGIYALNTIANYDIEVVPFLNSPYGTQYERNPEGNFIKIEE